MVRDHGAVNDKALALVKRLGVTPQDNPTYIANEVAYPQAVNQALEGTLIPSASNAALKSPLQAGLPLFREHQHHAEMLAVVLK